MMDYMLKPDRLNGQCVHRLVPREGALGVNHDNALRNFVLLEPKTLVGEVPALAREQLVEEALTRLITVSERTGDPVIKAQAVTFRGSLKKFLEFWSKRFALNERARLREQLRSLGFAQAAEAVKNG